MKYSWFEMFPAKLFYKGLCFMILFFLSILANAQAEYQSVEIEIKPATDKPLYNEVIKKPVYPYDVFILEGIDNPSISFVSSMTYPSASPDILIFRIAVDVKYIASDISFQVSDANNQLLLDQKLIGGETLLDMNALEPATYFVTIERHSRKWSTKTIKKIKVVKNW